MAHRIIHEWWTECSACGGNALREGEDRHVHGGPDRGPAYGKPGSTLDQLNGCQAKFDEEPVNAYGGLV